MTSQTIEGAAVPVRLLVVQNDPTDPPALLGQWWEEAGVELVLVRADQGEAVPTELPGDVDGLVVLGGEMAAWEDHVAPWLPDERTLVAGAVASGAPVLGVCLGGQVMTLACGGVVDRAPVAEVGVYEISLTDDAEKDPLFSVLPQGVPVAQYHGDAMIEAPEGAVLLGFTRDCPIQAYRLGDSAWAVQFHPEVDAEILGSWFGDDPAPVEKCGRSPEAVLTEMDDRSEEMRAAWRPFAHAFADVVRAAAGHAAVLMSLDGAAEGRAGSLQGRLARLGFADAALAVRLLSDPGLVGLGTDAVVDLSLAADPDLALGTLSRIADTGDAAARALVAELDEDEETRRRVLTVLGASVALGDHLVRHPRDWTVLRQHEEDEPAFAPLDAVRAELLRAVGADPADPLPTANGAGADVLAALRVAYRRRLLAIAASDLADGAPFVEVSAALADLADATLEAALAVARAEHPDAADLVRLAVIALGKCGGRELNYISDVDVVYVVEAHDGVDENDAVRAGTRLAQSLMRACNAPTPEGSIWEVDPNLRPEGKSGALVRTLASYDGYYRRWASTWEFQALLKARPAAGDLDLGRAFVDLVTPMVWSAADRPNFVEDVQAMRRRVEENVPAKDAERQLKLGAGGLRDVEFSVQLLQLVHGRSDVMLHSATTMTALESLATWGYVGREDASNLAQSYAFLRTLEHRIQLHRLRRTHVVPDSETALRHIARSMGMRTDPVAELMDTWKRHRREVRRLHEKLFYRPLLNAVARLDAGEARLTQEAARQRLEALGYVDPAGALRNLEALTSGVTRRAAIQRTLLPVMLGWFAGAPDPDAGLLAFRRMSDSLGSTPWYLRLLRDESLAAQRLATVLASSRYASDLLMRAPEGVTMLADDDELVPRTRDALDAEALAAARRHEDPEVAVAAVRALRRRELFRTAVAELLGTAQVDDAGVALSAIAGATITGALEIAVRAVEAERGSALPTRFLVVAMGRFGGGELGFASDADVLFVHDPLPGADDRDAHEAALAVAAELRRLLMIPTPDPVLEVDASLRPEGRNGPLVRTIASYASYYEKWSSAWEAQALLRAEPVAGDADLGREFVAIIDPLRYPEGGISDTDVREIRRLKARMEAERLPRGADPGLHTKLGRGGLSDVEWVAQLIALQHGHAVPALRTTRTLPALDGAVAAGLLEAEDAEHLASAWRIATRVRDAVMLVKGRASDMVPTDTRDLAAVSQVLGYPPGESGALLDDYRRITRRARGVVERVFYA